MHNELKRIISMYYCDLHHVSQIMHLDAQNHRIVCIITCITLTQKCADPSPSPQLNITNQIPFLVTLAPGCMQGNVYQKDLIQNILA